MKKLLHNITQLLSKKEVAELEPVQGIPKAAFAGLESVRVELNEGGYPAIFLDEPVMVDGEPIKLELGMDKIRYHNAETGYGKEIPKDAYESLHEEVRVELARKIAKLTPTLDDDKHKLLLSHTVDMLHQIARDQTERVRIMLAQEMSDMADADIEAVRTLAWDDSIEVARNILEHSPLLSDDELIDLIKSSNVEGVTEAIAGREGVGEPVTGELVKTENPATIQRLLENETSQIGEETFGKVVDMAKEHEGWHVALCERHELTQATINKVAEFVSRELVDHMKRHADVSEGLEQNVRLAASSRLQSDSVDRERDGLVRAQTAFEYNKLDADMIDDAIHALDRCFVIPAVALLSEIDLEIVKRIIASKNPKVILALAKQAGLSARMGYGLQMKIANVPHMKLIHPRGGTDFALSDEEMETYLEIFTG